MSTKTVFVAFNTGILATDVGERDFSPLPWNPHPVFPGVALKHLVTSAESGGFFSYHLVRIDSGMTIGAHVHDPQLETHEVIAGKGVCVNGERKVEYVPGVLTLFRPKVRHEVSAGGEGLLLFAKFMPPLC